MPRKNFILASVLSLCLTNSLAGEYFLSEETDLTKDEVKLFQTIAKFDKDFRYSRRVKRYYQIDPNTKEKLHDNLPVLVELIFPKDKDGFYFGEFVIYEVRFQPESSIVTYNFFAGKVHEEEGTIMVTPNGAVIKTSRSCGIASCTVQVVKNRKVLYEEHHSI